MTSTGVSSARRSAYRYGNPTVECSGAQMRAQCRQLATVVTISGVIDESNIDRVSQYTKRFVLAEKPFVLDLSDVRTFPPRAMEMLRTAEEACGAADVEWCLVAGEAVHQVLRTTDGSHAAFATATSVPEALNRFLDSTLARRRLLPLLNNTA
jgi:anti-anti-sigma regulatory factor